MKYLHEWGRKSLFSAISALLVVGFTFPVAVQAGMFSGLLFSLVAASQASYGTGGGHQSNVQTMQLPKAAMNIDPNPSRGGGEIVVIDGALLPEEGPSGTLVDSEGAVNSSAISLYVVREGDTLSGIAGLFSISVNTIRWGNDLTRNSTIRVGETLIILPVSGVKHTVKDGDTLASITKKYKGDLEEVVQFNGISADATLAIGTEVIIPDGEISSASAPSVSSRVAQTSLAPVYSGYYLRPIAGGVKTQGIHGYNGVDLAGSPGTPILASAAGEVIIVKNSGWNGGYGNYVVIRHDNGTQTLYAHNSSNIVFAGQKVVQGQIIAYMGSSGRSTGPHLHFEVRGARNPF